jgi:hypothetical protein
MISLMGDRTERGDRETLEPRKKSMNSNERETLWRLWKGYKVSPEQKTEYQADKGNCAVIEHTQNKKSQEEYDGSTFYKVF